MQITTLTCHTHISRPLV